MQPLVYAAVSAEALKAAVAIGRVGFYWAAWKSGIFYVSVASRSMEPFFFFFSKLAGPHLIEPIMKCEIIVENQQLGKRAFFFFSLGKSFE